jgi:hypothetical protein
MLPVWESMARPV